MNRLLFAAILPCCAIGISIGRSASADNAVDTSTPAVSPSESAGAEKLQVIVVTATAIPGTVIDIDKIPGNVQVLSARDLTREGSASLTSALNSNLSSININDDLDDPFQPDILYRGFEASPVLGTPQGLAVYQNGVRINEAFGDQVNWDLFPDIAINQVELVSSSPVYGLNALGGAISVTMKNGFTYQGADLELSGGSYGQRALSAQYGVNSGAFGFYVAGRALDWDGWRQFSNDRMRDLYAVFSAHTDAATLDLSYTRADNMMNGQGSAPVQELAVNRSWVFTGLWQHTGSPVPARRGHASHELGRAKPAGHFRWRLGLYRRKRLRVDPRMGPGRYVAGHRSQLLVLPSDLIVDTPENSPGAIARMSALPPRPGKIPGYNREFLYGPWTPVHGR